MDHIWMWWQLGSNLIGNMWNGHIWGDMIESDEVFGIWIIQWRCMDWERAS